MKKPVRKPLALKPNKIYTCWFAEGVNTGRSNPIDVCATTAADAREIYARQMNLPKSRVCYSNVRTLPHPTTITPAVEKALENIAAALTDKLPNPFAEI